MPELPEIETVKLQLKKRIVGMSIAEIEPRHKKSVQGDISVVKGKKIRDVRRIGKMLVIDLERDVHIAIHFKMSGQLILVHSSQFKVHGQDKEVEKRVVGGHPSADWVGELPSKHTRAIIRLHNGDELFFNDQRIFGWIEINSKFKIQNSKMWKYIEKLGPEIWDLSTEKFFQITKKRTKPIKNLLMDQQVISGIGNIYANDALWEAQIHPNMPAKKLNRKNLDKLRAAVIQVLNEGIKYGGATAPDQKYIDLHGLGGKYQEHFRVYSRIGEPCLRDDSGVIKKITLGGRGTYFCSKCQKL